MWRIREQSETSKFLTANVPADNNPALPWKKPTASNFTTRRRGSIRTGKGGCLGLQPSLPLGALQLIHCHGNGRGQWIVLPIRKKGTKPLLPSRQEDKGTDGVGPSAERAPPCLSLALGVKLCLRPPGSLANNTLLFLAQL